MTKINNTTQPESTITFSKALKYTTYRWLSAIIIVLCLNALIGWAMNAAIKTDINPIDVVQFSTYVPALLYALVALASVIACGVNIWAGGLTLLLVVYTNLQSGATLATTILPGILFQTLLVMVALLASLQVIRALYAQYDPDSFLPRYSKPAILFYGSLITLIIFLCSHAFHDFIYPYLLL